MTLLYPLGLIGLIGVPLLILIYILKSKYKETTVASTFLWELSDKFMKKKQPFSTLKGLLSLILQILCVIFVSLSLSHPILHLKDSAKISATLVKELKQLPPDKLRLMLEFVRIATM